MIATKILLRVVTRLLMSIIFHIIYIANQ
jgi:hypothetical protein